MKTILINNEEYVTLEEVERILNIKETKYTELLIKYNKLCEDFSKCMDKRLSTIDFAETFEEELNDMLEQFKGE